MLNSTCDILPDSSSSGMVQDHPTAEETSGTDKTDSDSQIDSNSDDEHGENEEPCACGLGKHKISKQWYKHYLEANTNYFDALDHDDLDSEVIEKGIHDMWSQVHMSPEYCPPCRDLLDSWPETLSKVSGKQHDYHHRPHFQSTVELETSYRKGCRLCVLMVQCIVSRGHTLENFHKIERRLKCLNKDSTIFMSIGRFVRPDLTMVLSGPGRPDSYDMLMDALHIVPAGNIPRRYLFLVTNMIY